MVNPAGVRAAVAAQMSSTLVLHAAELEHGSRPPTLAPGLCATYAIDATARSDFDAVCHDAVKLRAHLEGVRIEVKYEKGEN